MRCTTLLSFGLVGVLFLFGGAGAIGQTGSPTSAKETVSVREAGKSDTANETGSAYKLKKRDKKNKRKRIEPFPLRFLIPDAPELTQPSVDKEKPDANPSEKKRPGKTSSKNKPKIIWPPPRPSSDARPSTTGHREDHLPYPPSRFGGPRYLNLGKYRSPATSQWKTAEVFNYEYGYINPYYPFPADTPTPRPSGWDNHEGWVSKYLYDRSTVSPYLQLFRHDIYPYGSNLYNTLVRPELEAGTSFSHPSMLQSAPFHGSPIMGRPGKASTNLPTTGHPAHFQNGVTDLDQFLR